MAFSQSERAAPVVITADIDQKILRIRFCGEVLPEHVKVEVDRLAQQIALLGAGFAMVTDLSELENMDLDCAPHLTRLMDLCRAAGLDRVVRIIPDPRKDIGFNVLSQFHYRGRIPIAVCQTKAEAEKALSCR